VARPAPLTPAVRSHAGPLDLSRSAAYRPPWGRHHSAQIDALTFVVRILLAWQVRPSGPTAFTPVLVCSNNPAHTWPATLTSRATGSGCPDCREAGESKVELAHHKAAVRVFGAASSGQAVIDAAFTHGARWVVDITTVTATGLKVAIEYDGAYWHADKVTIEPAKSLDLLAAGWLVVRLREHPLPSLGIDHPRYAEIPVHATAPDPDGVLERVHTWANSAAR
jgi:hypothetical protein